MGNNFKNAFEYKVIYVFTIEDVAHRGLVKIGDATLNSTTSIDKLFPSCKELNQAALKRIKSYTNTAGLTPKLLHSEIAVRIVSKSDGSRELIAFRDHEVHQVLKNSGIENVAIGKTTGREWFPIDLETAKKAIDAVKQNLANLSNSDIVKYSPIIFRPEQNDAIQNTVKHFKKSDKMLWNAKMRFGKTICALEVVKKCDFGKTVIITHRPVVNDGWYDDFGKVFHDNKNYIYGSKKNGYDVRQLLQSGKKFVYFASVQDLRGSSQVGGKHNKNDIVFQTNWDCVIVDEAHEGTTTALGEDTVKAVLKEGSGSKFLALSGTPFNILSDYDENSIYTWDYIMEQESKSEWDKYNFGDSNPYDELPELRIYTYDLGDILANENYTTFEDKAFNFREFFRTWTGDIDVDFAIMPETARKGDFVHKDDIWSFLNLMAKEDTENLYPFSSEKYRNLFKHTLWMLPGVKEARAFKKLMRKHPTFGNGMFNIVNVAGSGDEEEKSEDALVKVRKAIKKSGENYTITLSCGKLTTGVTVKEWTAVFMLSGSYATSAANYLQTIFRVQSPCNLNGRIKENSYVFDFAPDRTLKMVSSAVSVSAKAGKTRIDDKQAIGKFINYCPVISISGSKMKEYSPARLLQQLKKAYADKVVRNGFDDSNLYSDELFKLQNVDIMKFDELNGIIGKTKAAPKTNDITINDQGLTNEEYNKLEELRKKKKKNLTPEELERLNEIKRLKKLRSDAISILRGISIRMPLLIFGADIPYHEEITLSSFVDVVDDSSWEEFMPNGVTKNKFKEFQKYYDEEIFIAAGRRIRNIARQADTLDPQERVQKIASLFAYFKNPDKETVLTPWRTVNMHMSDCIGGWDFWDEEHQETLDQPRFIDRGEVTTELFGRQDAKILEINSKTGLYPLYITYSAYRTKCDSFSGDVLSLEDKQKLWMKAVDENIFVICKTPMAKSITKRTLIGFTGKDINAHYFDDLLNVMRNKQQKFINKILKANYWKKEGKKMKFDACVGNPPYQASLGGASPLPIYHHFINQAKAIKATYISMITPARWFNTGKGLGNFREEMLNDDRIRVLHDYINANDCFNKVDIKGGIQYFLWDSKYHGKCDIVTHNVDGTIVESKRYLLEQGLDSYVRNSEVIPMLEKVRSNHEPVFSEIISSRDPFGYDIRIPGTMKVAPHQFSLEKTNEADVEFYYNGWRKNGVGYVKFSSVNDNKELVDKYKVLIPKAWGTGDEKKDKLNPFIVGPHSVCTETYLVVGAFDTEHEAKCVLSYIRTKFFHLMVSILKISQNAARGVYNLVPQQDFTKEWTDCELFDKYGFTDKEIRIIDSLIRSID